MGSPKSGVIARLDRAIMDTGDDRPGDLGMGQVQYRLTRGRV